jgi:hypothetical protein
VINVLGSHALIDGPFADLGRIFTSVCTQRRALTAALAGFALLCLLEIVEAKAIGLVAQPGRAISAISHL